jgi:predicted GIY-YIG superfamily endonuclease
MSFYCYLLITDAGHTYVGATTNPDRRLEQHNGKKSGGARATGMRVAQGWEWKRVCYITGIPEWRSALQIEWRWKQLGRTQFRGIRSPIDRRLRALKAVLELEKPTTNGIPYDAYPSGPPHIVWDSEEYKKQYESLISDYKEPE